MTTTATRPRPMAGWAQKRLVQFTRRSAADILAIATWASAAMAVALFLIDRGASEFATLPAAVTSIGIIAGLILTMLVLATRTRWLVMTS